jgi:hypothetical protein
MIFNYLSLHKRFDNFAHQAEWMGNAHLKCNDPKSRAIYYQYSDCRGSMASKMLSFQKETDSLFGWIKSFIPGTIAFNSRKELGHQLQFANKLFLNFSAGFYNNKQERKGANDSVNTKHEKRQDKMFMPDVQKRQSNKLVNSANDVPVIKRMGMWR